MMEGDSRVPRYDTPQYQTEEDRLRAEANNSGSCAVCESLRERLYLIVVRHTDCDGFGIVDDANRS